MAMGAHRQVFHFLIGRRLVPMLGYLYSDQVAQIHGAKVSI